MSDAKTKALEEPLRTRVARISYGVNAIQRRAVEKDRDQTRQSLPSQAATPMVRCDRDPQFRRAAIRADKQPDVSDQLIARSEGNRDLLPRSPRLERRRHLGTQEIRRRGGRCVVP